MRIRSVFSILTSVNNGNDNHNKQASYFIFSPFEAIFASSKFYKVARIYWVVASGANCLIEYIWTYLTMWTYLLVNNIAEFMSEIVFLLSFNLFIIIHHHLKWFQISFGSLIFRQNVADKNIKRLKLKKNFKPIEYLPK